MSDTLEIRPETDLAADCVVGSRGAALMRDGDRVERRRTQPNPGWYWITPKLGAVGPFETPQAARGRR